MTPLGVVVLRWEGEEEHCTIKKVFLSFRDTTTRTHQ